MASLSVFASCSIIRAGLNTQAVIILREIKSRLLLTLRSHISGHVPHTQTQTRTRTRTRWGDGGAKMDRVVSGQGGQGDASGGHRHCTVTKQPDVIGWRRRKGGGRAGDILKYLG